MFGRLDMRPYLANGQIRARELNIGLQMQLHASRDSDVVYWGLEDQRNAARDMQ